MILIKSHMISTSSQSTGRRLKHYLNSKDIMPQWLLHEDSYNWGSREVPLIQAVYQAEGLHLALIRNMWLIMGLIREKEVEG